MPKVKEKDWIIDPTQPIPMAALCECIVNDYPNHLSRRFRIGETIRGECNRDQFRTMKNTWISTYKGPAFINVEILTECNGIVTIKLPDNQRVAVPIAILHRIPNSPIFGWKERSENEPKV